MNIKELVLKRGKVRITIRKFPEGFLATVDCLDEDGDVEFGSTGGFADNPQNAAWNALDFYTSSWKEAPCPDFLRLIRKIKI